MQYTCFQIIWWMQSKALYRGWLQLPSFSQFSHPVYWPLRECQSHHQKQCPGLEFYQGAHRHWQGYWMPWSNHCSILLPGKTRHSARDHHRSWAPLACCSRTRDRCRRWFSATKDNCWCPWLLHSIGPFNLHVWRLLWLLYVNVVLSVVLTDCVLIILYHVYAIQGGT